MAVRVLIADDSIFIRDILRTHLQRFGFTVVAETENASQTLKLFRALKPEFITLDLVMPVVEGVDALGAFRTMREEDPAVQILLVSAIPYQRTREAFLREGAFDYLVKPFSKLSFERLRRKLEATFPELRIPRAGHEAAALPSNSHE